MVSIKLKRKNERNSKKKWGNERKMNKVKEIKQEKKAKRKKEIVLWKTEWK